MKIKKKGLRLGIVCTIAFALTDFSQNLNLEFKSKFEINKS